MTGKVWLVGAGPGDVGLFTLKGKQVLEQAEVVVYDSLVGDGVLAMVPAGARLINVGKRAGHHLMKQEMINQVLLEEAQKGYRVVRLKGGDPFLFGRGGEELELLSEHGIPYEVVPGVTSCIAVPAYNGIPVTHRDYCSSVHVITGHKKAGQSYNIDFEALVRTGGTLVFLMGVTALEDICSNLIKAGMSPSVPAAILQQGTTAGQKRIVATVGTLKEEVDRQGILTPAIIVVGGVCEVADRFEWYEKLPLAGCKIVVTRPKELISQMADRLRKQGAEVLELPAIALSPVEDDRKIRECLEQLEKYQWIAFTSPSGVKIFFEFLKKNGKDIRALGRAKIAAIGKGTKRELEARGMYPDLMPEVFDGDSLGKKMAECCEENSYILIPRAAIGNAEIIRELSVRKDLVVDDVATYETRYEVQSIVDESGAFERGEIDYAVFTSASTVRGFVHALPGLEYSKVKAVCIGKQTAAQAEEYGMHTYTAKEASIDSLVELVIQLAGEKK
ncbi:uroporphyrinogen-III synthase /uroporphyrinogen-III C-methyltransferase [Firmicutes bacterium CAG:646]|nr:uroporphyrinogen-III synthase /uroporphyrinogen-III C-methyltransferase [Firmicutes bacterium CAG:646]